MKIIDLVNTLAGRRLVFTLANGKQVIGELIESADDGFVIDAWVFDSYFGDRERKRLLLFKHAVAHITEWSKPEWMIKEGSMS